MRFLVTWKVSEDKWVDIVDVYSSMSAEERGDVGDGVSLVGRWHDLADKSGVAILESEDISAVFAYLGRWNAHMETTVRPVLEDEDAAEVGKLIVSAARS